MAAIFPLIRNWPTSRETVGTAFVISDDGHFATAAHIPESTPEFVFTAAPNPEDLKSTAAIEWLFISPQYDLAVGKLVAKPTDSPLVLAISLPEMDAPVEAFGFPASPATFFRDGKYLQIARPMIRRKATFRGYSADYNIGPSSDIHGFNYAARKMTAVLTSPPFPEGFSGGPVMDARGRVIGVNSSTQSDRALMVRLNNGNPFAVNAGADALMNLLQLKDRPLFDRVLAAAKS